MASILLIDDDEGLRESLLDILQDCGFEVTAVGTLAEARQALQTTKLSLIISDVTLPDGSGVSWIIEVRAAQPTLPLFLMTGLSEGDLPPIPAGITLLTKPVDPARLISLLKAQHP